MSRLQNLEVGKRLGLSFLLVTLLIIVSVAVGRSGMGSQHDISMRMDQLKQVEDDVRKLSYYAANIAGVAEAAAVTTEGVEQSRQAAAELAEMSTSLRELVNRFTV